MYAQPNNEQEVIKIERSLNENSVIPLYYQLAEILRGNISTGVWKPGEGIPSENELCRQYGVSRATVRRAILEIEKENLVYKKQGKGTIVSNKKIDKDLLGELSLYKEMKSIGLNSTSKVLEIEILDTPPLKVKSILHLKDNQKVIKILRVRLVDDEAFAVETTYLQHEKFSQILTKDLNSVILYEVLENEYNITFQNVTVFIEPIILNEYLSNCLEIGKGLPALSIERTINCNHSIKIFSHMVIRGDKAKFFVTTK